MSYEEIRIKNSDFSSSADWKRKFRPLVGSVSTYLKFRSVFGLFEGDIGGIRDAVHNQNMEVCSAVDLNRLFGWTNLKSYSGANLKLSRKYK